MTANWLNVSWDGVFLPEVSPLEIFVRGTVTYLMIFGLLRVVLKRQSGTVGMADLLVIVLIADAAQNAMAGQYHTVSDGLLLVATILFWSYVLDWLAFRFPRLGRILYPPPLPLVKDGRLQRRNLRAELISEDELMGQLREQGVHDLAGVELACIESDGRISVLPKEQHLPRAPNRPAV